MKPGASQGIKGPWKYAGGCFFSSWYSVLVSLKGNQKDYQHFGGSRKTKTQPYGGFPFSFPLINQRERGTLKNHHFRRISVLELCFAGLGFESAMQPAQVPASVKQEQGLTEGTGGGSKKVPQMEPWYMETRTKICGPLLLV